MNHGGHGVRAPMPYSVPSVVSYSLSSGHHAPEGMKPAQ
jgi:hypothetical protein